MALDIQDLTKTYPNGVRALGGVSLSIPRGMFGLLGPNGAGKSTLMRILATLQEADAGSVRFGDVDVLREKDRVRRMLGYLPQEFGVYPKVSAEDMLDHFALLKGVSNRKQRRELVRALLVQTNLWDARGRKLGGFSGGMKQRFGIAVALIGNPRLIIVDEPTAGLDPAERVRFLNLLSELGENAVVILSTHIVEDVAELCPRMAVISHGRILVEATPSGAVSLLQGKVWRRIVHRDHLPELQHRLPVISTRLVAGQTAVRVLATEAPDPWFELAEPGLEDVYFTVMRGIPLGQVPPPAWALPAAVGAPPSPQAAVPDGSASGPAASAPSAGPAASVAPSSAATAPIASPAVDPASSSPTPAPQPFARPIAPSRTDAPMFDAAPAYPAPAAPQPFARPVAPAPPASSSPGAPGGPAAYPAPDASSSYPAPAAPQPFARPIAPTQTDSPAPGVAPAPPVPASATPFSRPAAPAPAAPSAFPDGPAAPSHPAPDTPAAPVPFARPAQPTAPPVSADPPAPAPAPPPFAPSAPPTPRPDGTEG